MPRALLIALTALALAAGCGGGGGPEEPEGPAGVIAFGAAEGDAHALYLVQPDGAGLRALSPEAGPVALPHWSPGGGRIAYFTGAGDVEGPATLRVYDFGAGAARTVSDAALSSPLQRTAAWSPGGDRLAFIDAEGLVRLYDAEAGETAELDDVAARGLDWEPDGDRLVIAGPEAGQLSILDTGSGEVEPIVDRTGTQGGPSWSPDGDVIVFWSASDEAPAVRTLFAVEPDGDGLTQLPAGFAVRWTPDGERIAYSGPEEPGAANDILTLDPREDGATPERVAEAVTDDLWPSWAPDGSGIAYLAVADRGSAFLCVVRFDPEARDCLDLGTLVPSQAAWAPAGR